MFVRTAKPSREPKELQSGTGQFSRNLGCGIFKNCQEAMKLSPQRSSFGGRHCYLLVYHFIFPVQCSVFTLVYCCFPISPTACRYHLPFGAAQCYTTFSKLCENSSKYETKVLIFGYDCASFRCLPVTIFVSSHYANLDFSCSVFLEVIQISLDKINHVKCQRSVQ